MRIGNGIDVHRLEAGRRLVLGGVEIPCALGLVGHSDADVLTHAVMDALLGAAGLADIGHYFPDTEERYRGADSMELLQEVVRLIGEEGYCVSNVDTTVAAQVPKLAPFIPEMKQRLAGVLKIAPERVGVKATTTERLGFCGREEGIAAFAVCLLEETDGKTPAF